MVGYYYNLIIGSFGSLYGAFNTSVYCFHRFFNRFVYSGMTYHVAVGVIDYDKIKFLRFYCLDKFVTHFKSAHFRLEVISSHFGRSHKDALLSFKGCFTTAVKEKCHMSVFFCLGYVQLLFIQRRKVFAKCIAHIFLVKQNVYAGKRCIVRSHAIILQIWNCLHACFGDVVLSESDCKLFCTVVAVIEENNRVTFFNGAVYSRIVYGLYKFVCNILVVRLLHSLYHVCRLLALSVYKKVVSDFHTLPTFVSVHGIVSTHN